MFFTLLIHMSIFVSIGYYLLYNLLWGRRIYGPGPLALRAQDPGRGDLLPRTISRSAPHRTPKEKDKLSTGAG